MGKNNSRFGQHFPSRYLLVQIQQWKHLNNVWNLLKCNNDDTRTKSVMVFYLTLNRFSTLFSCFHFWFRTSTIPAGQLLLRIIIIKYMIAVKSQVIKHHNCRHCIIFWILGEGKPLKPKVKLTTKVKIRFHPYLVRQGKPGHKLSFKVRAKRFKCHSPIHRAESCVAKLWKLKRTNTT